MNVYRMKNGAMSYPVTLPADYTVLLPDGWELEALDKPGPERPREPVTPRPRSKVARFLVAIAQALESL